jgi:hypothetical protein
MYDTLVRRAQPSGAARPPQEDVCLLSALDHSLLVNKAWLGLQQVGTMSGKLWLQRAAGGYISRPNR